MVNCHLSAQVFFKQSGILRIVRRPSSVQLFVNCPSNGQWTFKWSIGLWIIEYTSKDDMSFKYSTALWMIRCTSNDYMSFKSQLPCEESGMLRVSYVVQEPWTIISWIMWYASRNQVPVKDQRSSERIENPSNNQIDFKSSTGLEWLCCFRIIIYLSNSDLFLENQVSFRQLNAKYCICTLRGIPCPFSN